MEELLQHDGRTISLNHLGVCLSILQLHF